MTTDDTFTVQVGWVSYGFRAGRTSANMLSFQFVQADRVACRCRLKPASVMDNLHCISSMGRRCQSRPAHAGSFLVETTRALDSAARLSLQAGIWYVHEGVVRQVLQTFRPGGHGCRRQRFQPTSLPAGTGDACPARHRRAFHRNKSARGQAEMAQAPENTGSVLVKYAHESLKMTGSCFCRSLRNQSYLKMAPFIGV